MGKSVEEICNILIKNYANNNTADNFYPDFNGKKTLANCTVCSHIDKYNPYQALFTNENLYNKLERQITQKLAIAIDNNDTDKIRTLKKKYGNLEEFKSAKNYLNKKCKEIWNVYEPIKSLPKEAMKCLGITNQPDLDFIFENSLKFFEKDDSETTSYIISSTLKNPNLNYDINDIHKYLKEKNIKSKCKYNFKTVKYLIKEHNYNKDQLNDLGVEINVLKKALEGLPFRYKLKMLLP